MAPTVVAAEGFSFSTGGSGQLLTYAAGAPTVGDWDILCVNSDTTVSTPSGFTLLESRVVSQGAYIFGRKAVGGEAATVTVTTTGSHPTRVGWIRVRGANTVDLSENVNADGPLGTTTPAFTSSTLAATGEISIAMAALHNFTSTPTGLSWSGSFVSAGINGGQGTGATAPYQSVATKVPTGTAQESVQASWTNSVNNRYLLFVTLTAAPIATVTGTLAATLPALTADMDGEVTDAGTLTATLPALTAELDGEVVAEGVLAATLPALEADMDGRVVSLGVLQATLPGLESAFIGEVTDGGILAVTLPALESALAGEVTDAGALAATLPAVESAFTGEVTDSGTLNTALPALESALTGEVTDAGVLAAELPALESALTGSVEAPGVLVAVLPGLESAFVGEVTDGGVLGATLPPLESDFDGGFSTGVTGVLAVTLPALVADLDGAVDTGELVDMLVFPMLEQLYACFHTQIMLVPDPPATVRIKPGGQVAYGVSLTEDDCRCGLAWVRTVAFGPTDDYPTPAGPSKCPHGVWALRFEMGAVRCAPWGSAQRLPTAAEEYEVTRKQHADAAAMRRAVACCFGTPDLLPILGEYAPEGPEGLCVGGTMQVTVRRIGCDDCQEA